ALMFATTLWLGAVGARAVEPIRLDVGGGQFVDHQGRVVLMRGVNIVDKCGTNESVTLDGCPVRTNPGAESYPNDDSLMYGFTIKDAEFLKKQGFNVVRLGISFSNLLPQRPATPGSFTVNQTYLDTVVRVARLLADQGIWYFVDMHQDCFEEWPAWAIP